MMNSTGNEIEEITNFLAITQQQSTPSDQLLLPSNPETTPIVPPPDQLQQQPSSDHPQPQIDSSTTDQPPSNSDSNKNQKEKIKKLLLGRSNRSKRNSSRRRTRTRTQSYIDEVRHEQGFLDDNLPPRSNTVVASSSQHILATALRRDTSSNDSMSLNAITISFSILPIRNRDTPSWLFTLPSPSIPPIKHRPAHRKSHQPMCPAEVDQMLFSPDGTHLLIMSHTSSAHDGLGHLRLSILVQAVSRADEWSLCWDEVVCDLSVRGVHDMNPLEPHTKRVLRARFLAEPRRWVTEPVPPEIALPDDEITMVKGVRYRKLKRPRSSAINRFAQGKGQTVAMVLNTNELFIVHLPLPQSNLPPHVLLTTLSNSTLPTTSLKLTPTPASVRVDKKRTITQDSERPSQGPQPESVVSQIVRKVNETISQNVGLGISVESTPFPMMNDANPEAGPSTNPSGEANLAGFGLTPLLENVTPDPIGLKTANPNGEMAFAFNPNHYNQFDVSMNSFISTRKEIRTAAIGFPLASKDVEETFDEPRILIAFQSKIRPIIPTPIKQIVLPPTAEEGKNPEDSNQINGSQFSMVEDDLGNYITGLGDLDEAFDTPPSRNYHGVSQNSGNPQTEDQKDQSEMTVVGEDGKTEESLSMTGKRKGRQDLIEHHNKQRRYEPVSGIDESGPKVGTGDQASYGLVELVEVFVEFEESVIPTIAIQPLPSVPILDPFEHEGDCRVTIRSLDFSEQDHESTSTSPPLSSSSSFLSEVDRPAIRLLASYSREKVSINDEENNNSGNNNGDGDGGGDGEGFNNELNLNRSDETVDELQCWDAHFERSNLSDGFLGLECFSESQRINRSGLDQQLNGPKEWVFIRTGFKRLDPNLSICKVITDWRCRLGSNLIFTKRQQQDQRLGDSNEDDGEDVDGEGAKKIDEDCYEDFRDYECECIVLNSKDLSVISIRALPSLEDLEAKRVTISANGVWCLSVDPTGKVRALPLISVDQIYELVGLITSSIFNREPLEDIARLINFSSSDLANENINSDNDQTMIEGDINSRNDDGFLEKKKKQKQKSMKMMMMFEHISNFLASSSNSFKSYDLDPLLSPAWSFGYDLWCSTPGYEKSAEIALIGRQLSSALSLGTSIKQEGYVRSIWPMIGLTRWYIKLCIKIIKSVDKDSKTSHLCLIPMSSCTFFYLFKMIFMISSFSQWLTMMRSASAASLNGANSISQIMGSNGLVSLCDEIDLARVILNEIWDNGRCSVLSMEIWVKALQEIGPSVLPMNGSDHSALPVRQIEMFSVPLAASEADQIEESVDQFKKVIEKYRPLNQKQGKTVINLNEGDHQNLQSSKDEEEDEEEEEEEDLTEYDLINGGTRIDERVLRMVESSQKNKKRDEWKMKGLKDSESLTGERENYYYRNKSKRRKRQIGEREDEVEEDDLRRKYRRCAKCRCKSKVNNKFNNNFGLESSVGSSNVTFNNNININNNNNSNHDNDRNLNGTEALQGGQSQLAKPQEVEQRTVGSNILKSNFNISSFDFSIREFERRCICFGVWVSL